MADQQCNDLTAPVTNADHALGPAGLAVTIVEYGDYECPDCFNAVPIMKGLPYALWRSAAGSLPSFSARARFILEPTLAAAYAAEAAAGQGKFWEMHDAACSANRKS